MIDLRTTPEGPPRDPIAPGGRQMALAFIILFKLFLPKSAVSLTG
jgi:hypothetical protein